METEDYGICRHCKSLVKWNDNYVRMFTPGDGPQPDSEQFAHLGCFMIQLVEGVEMAILNAQEDEGT